MRKLFFVISVVGSVFFMTACGLNEEENITPSIDEMVVAPAATDSPSPSQLRRKGRSKMSLHQRRIATEDTMK